MACDDEVVAGTGNPRGYAKCLISLLEKSLARRGWTMAQAAVHRAGEASCAWRRFSMSGGRMPGTSGSQHSGSWVHFLWRALW